jgi:hypothetical protein
VTHFAKRLKGTFGLSLEVHILAINVTEVVQLLHECP